MFSPEIVLQNIKYCAISSDIIMSVQIVFGSETGTAEDIACSLYRKLLHYHDFGINLRVCDCNNYEFLSPCVSFFICSTCGQGDPPKNMLKFWKTVMSRKVPEKLFAGVKFAVLAIGDSSYSKFNFVGKKLFRRIEMLGGTVAAELRLADEQHDFGCDFQSELFKNDCISLLSSEFKFDQNNPLIALNKPLDCSVVAEPLELAGDTSVCHWKHNCPRQGTIVEVKRQTSSDHFQNTILVTVQFNADNYPRKNILPGDVLAVQPKNSQCTVETFFELFPAFSKEEYVSVTSISEQPISILFLVTAVLDLNSVPKRSLFELMYQLSDDENEKEKLEEFHKDQEQYYSYCCRPRRTILEVFQDFPQTRKTLSLARVIELVPKIKERCFSLASTVMKFESGEFRVQILVAVVKYQSKIKRPRLGLCSNYLKDFNIGSEINIEFHKGSFNLPEDPNVPLIMIGPGTGVAPFRSFIQRREGKNCFLFFGCRHPEKDFYFKQEWNELYPEVQVFPAFSRLHEGNTEYVQHKISVKGELVWDLISNKGAFVYLAGTSKRMPKDVRDAVVKIIGQHGELDVDDSEVYFNNLVSSGRFQEETW